MIPYEELVVALQTWRAKQGLPVAQLSGALTPPMAPPAMAPGPPMAPPRPQAFLGNVATPPPVALADDEVDEAALLEEAHYENEGDDFAMNFAGQAAGDGEDSTAIGHMPPPLERPSEFSMEQPATEAAPPAPGKSRNRNDDW